MLALCALAACESLPALGGGEDGAAGADAATPEPAPEEAPAPEVFDLAAEGLWDGRPALGGVWVAHPDVRTPERVLIRSGDAEVDGALFRREFEAAGPPFQLSSAAATALGIPPGTPRPLRVTALRPVAEPDPADAPDETPPDPAPEPAPEPDPTPAEPETP